jgi:hypothetical protein
MSAFDQNIFFNNLHEALKNRNMSSIVHMIETLTSDHVNITDQNGNTPLILLAYTISFASIMTLIRKGANINHQNKYGDTALMIASMIGNSTPIIQHLLKSGARTDIKNKDGHTAAMIAADKGFVDIVKLLLGDSTPANESYPFEIICDPLGYRQHTGECWVDTFQELFFFSDGLKEITQLLFYNISDTDIDTHLTTAHTRGLLSEQQFIDLKSGIKAMRDRFIYHYKYIRQLMTRKEYSGENSRNIRAKYLANNTPHAILKRVHSAKFSAKIGANLQSDLVKLLTIRKNQSYVPGESSDYYVPLWDTICKIFSIPFTVINITPNIYIPMDQVSAVGLGMYNVFEQADGMNTFVSGGHATGFLKCNGKWYYYDNNYGLLPVEEIFVYRVVSIVGRLAESLNAYCIRVIENRVYFLQLSGLCGSYNNETKTTQYTPMHQYNSYRKLQISKVWTSKDEWVDRINIPGYMHMDIATIEISASYVENGIPVIYSPLSNIYIIRPISNSVSSSSASSRKRKRSLRRQKRTRKLRH